MSLSSNQSTEDQLVFFDPIKILDIKNISGTPAREGWQANDCALDVTFCRLDENGKVLEPDSDPWTMFCQGNFKRNAEGKMIDWGGAFKVRTLLEACGLEGKFVDDDGSLDMQLANNCIMKHCYKVSYRSTDVNEEGKNKIKSWSGRFFQSAAKASMAWNKSLTKGWPKDFIGLPGNESMQGRDPEPAQEVAATQFPTDL